jgi:hypothetical protein
MSEFARLTRSGASAGEAALDATRALLKKTETFMDGFKGLGKTDMSNVFKGMDADDLAKTMKGLPDDDLVTIGKSLDQKTINRLAKTSDGQELLAKMGRTQVTVGTQFSKAARAGGDFLKKFGTKTSGILKKISNSTKKGLNRLAKKADETPAQQAKKMKEEGPKVAKEVTEQAPDAAKAADDVAELSPEAKNGLKKLGMYTAGGTLVLMLVYGTMNPFEAIRDALKDVGEVGKGLKEVADSAANAAKDVAVGGFDFLSFITKNAWISGSSSILLMIMCVALIAMSFLGNNGGGGGRRVYFRARN